MKIGREVITNFHIRKIITLKEQTTETNFFLVINILLLKKLLKECKTVTFPIKINTISFKEWMTATLPLTKTDTFKGQTAVIKVVKLVYHP